MYYDCHNHSCFSKDAPDKTPLQSCESALKCGLSGIAFTEHANLRLAWGLNSVKKGVAEVLKLKQKYEGKLKVFTGIELADIPYYPELLKKSMEICSYDSVLCSVHLLEYKGNVLEMAATDFTDTPIEEIYEILKIYYDDMLKSVYTASFNILCHITYPLRYFNGKYKKNVTLDKYASTIEDILKIVIDKKAALEINTAKATADGRDFCPEGDVVRLYKSLGGSLFTLGSDSHTIGTEGKLFDKAAEMLKNNGVGDCCYFENGIPHSYKI